MSDFKILKTYDKAKTMTTTKVKPRPRSKVKPRLKPVSKAKQKPRPTPGNKVKTKARSADSTVTRILIRCKNVDYLSPRMSPRHGRYKSN